MDERTINEPSLFSNFDANRTFEVISELSNRSGIGEYLKSADLVADLGSSIGGSAVAIGRICKKAEIHSVDAVFSKIHENFKKELGDRHTHYRENIHSYLRKMISGGKKIDVALLKSVPEHQLEKQGGYELLADAVKNGGIVLAVGDTALDKVKMESGFNLLYGFDNEPYIEQVWRRK